MAAAQNLAELYKMLIAKYDLNCKLVGIANMTNLFGAELISVNLKVTDKCPPSTTDIPPIPLPSDDQEVLNRANQIFSNIKIDGYEYVDLHAVMVNFRRGRYGRWQVRYRVF